MTIHQHNLRCNLPVFRGSLIQPGLRWLVPGFIRDDRTFVRGMGEGRNGDSQKPFMFKKSIKSPFLPSHLNPKRPCVIPSNSEGSSQSMQHSIDELLSRKQLFQPHNAFQVYNILILILIYNFQENSKDLKITI
jgi:hypothetical protein